MATSPDEISGTRKRFSFTPPVSPLKVDPPNQEKMMPFVIGVSGGSASGKVRKIGG